MFSYWLIVLCTDDNGRDWGLYTASPSVLNICSGWVGNHGAHAYSSCSQLKIHFWSDNIVANLHRFL